MESRKTKKDLVSVIIPSFNSAETIGPVLEALQSQVLDTPWYMEILVVDGSGKGPSPDGTSEMAKRYGVKVLQSPGFGAVGNRNEGIKHAKGELFVFIDSDCRPVDDRFLMKHIEHHRVKEPKLIVCGSRTCDTRNRNIISDIDHSCNTWFKDPLLNPVGDGPTKYIFFASCNFSCRPDAFQIAGNFDKKYVRSQDTEWAFRAQQSGILIVYYKDIEVAHYGPRSWKSLTSHSYIYNYYITSFSDQHLPSIIARTPMQKLVLLHRYGVVMLRDYLMRNTRYYVRFRKILGLSNGITWCSLPLVWFQTIINLFGFYIGGICHLYQAYFTLSK